MCTPAAVAAEAGGAGLSSLLADARSYLRAAALDSRFALDTLGLLDLAECLDSVLPDCLQSSQRSNKPGAKRGHLCVFYPLCFCVPLPAFKDCRPSNAQVSVDTAAGCKQAVLRAVCLCLCCSYHIFHCVLQLATAFSGACCSSKNLVRSEEGTVAWLSGTKHTCGMWQ